MMFCRRSMSALRSSGVSGSPVMGQMEPRVCSQSMIVSRSKTLPAGVRTGSFIMCPLMAHAYSRGMSPRASPPAEPSRLGGSGEFAAAPPTSFAPSSAFEEDPRSLRRFSFLGLRMRSFVFLSSSGTTRSTLTRSLARVCSMGGRSPSRRKSSFSLLSAVALASCSSRCCIASSRSRSRSISSSRTLASCSRTRSNDAALASDRLRRKAMVSPKLGVLARSSSSPASSLASAASPPSSASSRMICTAAKDGVSRMTGMAEELRRRSSTRCFRSSDMRPTTLRSWLSNILA
mmetsp:Transcript_1471/g.3920  ORF Transcript_1471/g.3920 Transcript_1471/m.3920 type:complete len:290 (-) Transcript_1471:1710-2579(-)